MSNRLLSFLFLAAILVLFMPHAVEAQAISVVIDGRQISFDQPPVMLNGNVMVPMRGVFEELGADVKWKSATRTIFATKGTTEIIIQIGSPFASVGGKTQQLAAPAAMIGGSMMVPLRFVSEALGAEVKWDGATKTVAISSGGTAAVQTPAPQATPAPVSAEAPRITNVSHHATGPLQPGDSLLVTLTGDPGCTATFDVYGLGQSIPMTETSPGAYSGTFKIPANASNVQSASVFGRLNRGGRESMSATDGGIRIIATYVKVMKIVPPANSVVQTNRPNILIVLDSTGGVRIQPGTVNLYLNNQPVAGQASVSEELVSYVPGFDLPQGQNSIVFSAKDTLGNPVYKNWTFMVKTVGRITSVTHNATVPLGPGQALQVNLQGDPGGRATFDIGTFRTGIAMVETSPGAYVGNYTIQAGDSFQNAPVKGNLQVPNQTAAALTASTTVSVKKELFLQITSPVQGSTVDKQFVIAGTTNPYAKVYLNVKVLLGGVVENQLVSGEVQANEAGAFQVTIKDWFPVGGGTYTMTLYAQDAQGQKSGTVTLRVNRK